MIMRSTYIHTDSNGIRSYYEGTVKFYHDHLVITVRTGSGESRRTALEQEHDVTKDASVNDVEALLADALVKAVNPLSFGRDPDL